MLRLVFEGALLKLAGKPNELANNCRDQENTQKLHTHTVVLKRTTMRAFAAVRGGLRASHGVGENQKRQRCLSALPSAAHGQIKRDEKVSYSIKAL